MTSYEQGGSRRHAWLLGGLVLILAGFVWGEAIGGLAMLVGALAFLAALVAVLMHGPAAPVERPVRPWERR